MTTPKRHICDKCMYPQKTCICAMVTRFSAPIEIVLLQDKWEAKHAKNTGRLVVLNITNARIINCDTQAQEIAELKHQCANQPAGTALVFPLTTAQPFVVPKTQENTQIKRLIFIDTTWRKSTRLLELHAWLKDLHCFVLTDNIAGNYEIRKSVKSGGVSTLEAVSELLSTGYNVDTTPLHKCFLQMQQYWKDFSA